MKLLYVIPSYQPDRKLLEAAGGLLGTPENNTVVIVDDGSGNAYREFFDGAEALGATVLHHDVNRGKGRALKTAFEWFRGNCPDFDGIVTLDSDGQHKLPDIKKCAADFALSPDALVLGSRDFDAPQVPFKSRNGNKITRAVFRYLCGIHLSDTQTGLRVIPAKFALDLINVPGERFEYETNMLLEAKKRDVPFVETQISTVYENNNSGTHFHPLRDAVRIYSTFAKYVASALSSALIDIVLAGILMMLLKDKTSSYIGVSIVLARVISAFYNFLINRQWVFKRAGRSAILRYAALAVIQMFLSTQGTKFLYLTLGMPNEVVSKIIVDAVLFIISFGIQRSFVFRRKSQ